MRRGRGLLRLLAARRRIIRLWLPGIVGHILALKDQIQQRVEEIWGIHLEMEPVLVGF